MKIIYFITLAICCIQKAICYDVRPSHTKEVALNKTESKNAFDPGRSMVIPLLDIGVLWAENELVRSKRNPPPKAMITASGFLNGLAQNPKDKIELDSSDAFVESLVSLMSKSDPALLLKLRKRIEEFENEHKPKPHKNDEKRPLIQFFNITKISLPSSNNEGGSINLGEGNVVPRIEDIIARGKKYEKKEMDLSGDVVNKEHERFNELNANPGTDITTYFEAKDGQVARIQRSKDKRRYWLEINYTTENSISDEKRRRRTAEIQNYVPEDVQLRHWERIVGCSPKNKLVEHSFLLNE